MKQILILFIGALFVLSACSKEQLIDEKNEIISGNPYQAMSLATTLKKGIYIATINDTPMKVAISNGVLQWIIPNMEQGTYKMTIDKLDFNTTVQIKNGVAVKDAEKYLLAVANTLDMGLTRNDVLDMPKEKQQQFAAFLKTNEQTIAATIHNKQPQKTPKASTSLQVNESVTVTVVAKEKWNASGIAVNAGEQYQITASGIWTDWFIDTDADGFSSWYMDIVGGSRRAPDENWFKLIAAIDRQKNYPIGSSNKLVATESGSLEFYANDIPSFYWNNKGEISVIITRIL